MPDYERERERRKYREWAAAMEAFHELEAYMKVLRRTRVEMRGRSGNNMQRQAQQHKKPVRPIIRPVIKRTTRNQL